MISQNAKKELLSRVGNLEVEYLQIQRGDLYSDNVLKIQGKLCQNNLDLLDFEYDSGYGSQVLFGYVWFTDGTWLERFEYDGSECWHHITRPIPDENFL